MNKKLLTIIIILIGVITIGYFAYYTIPTEKPVSMDSTENNQIDNQNNNNTEPEEENMEQADNNTGTIETNATSTPETETPVNNREERTVTYSNSGFIPETLQIKAGQSVFFKNESGGLMWVASDNHPTHEILPEFDQGTAVSNGGEYTFRFDQAGEWKYHNHLKSSETGTIVVTE